MTGVTAAIADPPADAGAHPDQGAQVADHSHPSADEVGGDQADGECDDHDWQGIESDTHHLGERQLRSEDDDRDLQKEFARRLDSGFQSVSGFDQGRDQYAENDAGDRTADEWKHSADNGRHDRNCDRERQTWCARYRSRCDRGPHRVRLGGGSVRSGAASGCDNSVHIKYFHDHLRRAVATNFLQAYSNPLWLSMCVRCDCV